MRAARSGVSGAVAARRIDDSDMLSVFVDGSDVVEVRRLRGMHADYAIIIGNCVIYCTEKKLAEITRKLKEAGAVEV